MDTRTQQGHVKPDMDGCLVKLIQFEFKQGWQPGSAALPLGFALSSVREPESAPSASLSDSPPSKSLPGDYTTICKLNIIHRCHTLRHVSLELIFRPVVDDTHLGCYCSLLGQVFLVNPTLKASRSRQHRLWMICIPSFTRRIKSRV